MKRIFLIFVMLETFYAGAQEVTVNEDSVKSMTEVMVTATRNPLALQ
jgi:hypothetical protein